MFALALLCTANALSANAQTLPLPSAPQEQCSAAPSNTPAAAEWLNRAAAAVLPAANESQIMRFRVAHLQPLWEQSDRMYPPFIPAITETDDWFDVANRVEGRTPIARAVAPHHFPAQLYRDTSGAVGHDTAATYSPLMRGSASDIYRFNPWAVLTDWRANPGNAHVVERCIYRDYPRIVIARGRERLYLNEADAIPIKLERIEPHYLWGQAHVEYLWTTWWGVVGSATAMYPVSTTRYLENVMYDQSEVQNGQARLIPADSAPALAFPAIPPAGAPATATAALPVVDTVRVGEHTFVLTNPSYNEVVTLQRDTVFLLDATTSELRGRADSAWIAKLYPGTHPMVVVVTDLAWPHISSVRYWVSQHATVVSHVASQDFLQRVIDRRWQTRDALESARTTSHLVFRGVTDSMRLAGGAIVAFALQGQPNETALGVWIPGDHFLWAGDYLQPEVTSPYTRPMVATVRRLGFDPLKVAGEHTPLVDWSKVASRFPAAPHG